MSFCTSKRRLLALGLVSMLATGVASAAEEQQAGKVVGWRTNGQGIYASATPPTTWTPTTNVLWSVPSVKSSNATPVLVGDRVIYCAEPSVLICASTTDGKTIWEADLTPDLDVPLEERKRLAEARAVNEELGRKIDMKQREVLATNRKLTQVPDNAELKAKLDALNKELAQMRSGYKAVPGVKLPDKHDVNGYTSPTPVTDGTTVWTVFGTGIVSAHQVSDGKQLWSRSVDVPRQGWGHSASPVLVGGKLLVHINDLRALDPVTGKELWRADVKPKWGSSVPAKIGDVDVLITPAGSIVRVSDGVVLASKLSEPELEYNAPVVQGDVVYFIQSQSRAYRLPANVSDNKVKLEPLWNADIARERYYSSPLVLDGLVYAVMQQGVLTVLDASTGKVVYTKQLDLGGTFYPSITGAGKSVFVSSDNGTTVVLEAGKVYKEIARNQFDPFRSCLVFDGQSLYIRSLKALYRIGPKPQG
jgi:outer membrane protein assembly factor BamB